MKSLAKFGLWATLLLVLFACVLFVLPLLGSGTSQVGMALPGSSVNMTQCNTGAVCPDQRDSSNPVAIGQVAGDVPITQPAAPPDRPAMEQVTVPGIVVIIVMVLVIVFVIRRFRSS